MRHYSKSNLLLKGGKICHVLTQMLVLIHTDLKIETLAFSFQTILRKLRILVGLTSTEELD